MRYRLVVRIEDGWSSELPGPCETGWDTRQGTIQSYNLMATLWQCSFPQTWALEDEDGKIEILIECA